jgi:hypothetical protein
MSLEEVFTTVHYGTTNTVVIVTREEILAGSYLVMWGDYFDRILIQKDAKTKCYVI